MKSAVLCVFFALIVHKEGSLAADEDFKPTPIPLGDYDDDSTQSATGTGAGTLQEIIATDAPPATAAVPAHYWEDALRHSVYLTLVRDKIDQLIAKTSAIPPDARPEHSQKDDDHDLWEKIKTAPFDRLNVEEPAILGDVTIVSKGRLLEEKNGLKFTEEELSKEKCNDEKCNEGVKAYWSVKRVRQRDAEIAPGKYHYELTFSVSSQTTKKQKKPYEHPVRTFTVREGTPVEQPQYRFREPISHAPRPQRAVWFHKNIAPTPHRQKKEEDGLDRLFSSWFLDDEPPKRYKHVSYVPQMHPQHSKVGHIGASTEQHHQKHGQTPFPYKPPSPNFPSNYKYSRPPLGPPIVPPVGPPPVSYSQSQHHYHDLDAIRNQNQFTPPTPPDVKYLSSNVIKTTKPAVLPTAPISYAPLNMTMDLSSSSNVTETITSTKDPDIITGFTMYSKPKPPPTKISYFPEHVRPPVFNAPPGVFVTMDKKPFKPMPPLKYMHSFKQNKHKPIDFRPSPQVLDAQFSEPDPLSDAFRPIAMNYGTNVSDSSEQADGEKRKPVRKSKPPKKHDKIKTHRHTTSAPDIITAQGEVLGSDMDWASYLGAFVKTTPMVSQKMNFTETTTPLPFTTVSSTTSVETTTGATEPTTTTSHKPKRTRPPPKFSKPEKIKKHKRVTSSTGKPLHRRPTPDLTPQASSAPTKSSWQSTNKTQNDNASSTLVSDNVTNVATVSTITPEPLTAANMVPTTYRAPTTTRQKIMTSTTTDAPTTTTEKATTLSTTPPKSKNRFRQSTLLIKGTSVKHDKWSSPFSTETNKTNVEMVKRVFPLSGKFSRRKGSNFHGYGSSTPRTVDEEHKREDHADHVFKPNLNVISLGKSETTTDAVTTTPTTTPNGNEESEELNEQSEFEDATGEPEDDEDDNSDDQENVNEGEVQETKDKNEYIFDSHSSDSQTFGDELNDVEPEITTTTKVSSIYSVAKNKTKCKKKKNNTTNLNQPLYTAARREDDMSVAPIETTTEKLSTADFFNQIFGFTVDQNETHGNSTESKYVDNDEDLEEFLHSINEKKETNETNDDEEYEEDDKEEAENSPFNNDEENRSARSADTDFDEDYQDRPYSFLELMAME